MGFLDYPAQFIIGIVIILSSLGMILFRNPVHASLSFMLTLLSLAALYLQLAAEFIGVMQILVYTGAILVLFMFVIVLFQDAHQDIETMPAQSVKALLVVGGVIFSLAFLFLGELLLGLTPQKAEIPKDFGSVETLGWALYIDFFFPFEAVIFLFLIAIVGALYIAKKVRYDG